MPSRKYLILRRRAAPSRRTQDVRAASRRQFIHRPSGLPFDDQRIDHGEALTFGMDDDRVEIDFLDQLGVIGGETRQGRDKVGQRRTVGGGLAADSRRAAPRL